MIGSLGAGGRAQVGGAKHAVFFLLDCVNKVFVSVSFFIRFNIMSVFYIQSVLALSRICEEASGCFHSLACDDLQGPMRAARGATVGLRCLETGA